MPVSRVTKPVRPRRVPVIAVLLALLAHGLAAAPGPAPAPLPAGGSVRAVTPVQWRLHALSNLEQIRGHLWLPDIAPHLFGPEWPHILSRVVLPVPHIAAGARLAVAVPDAPAHPSIPADVIQCAAENPSTTDQSPPIDVLLPPPRIRPA